MPIDNLAKRHFTSEQKQLITSALSQLNEIVINMTEQTLTGKERSKYGKVGEHGKLLINKVKDYHDSQPSIASPEVDWEEFDRDYNDRVFAGGILSSLEILKEMMTTIKILRDHDNKTDALRDYHYAQYKYRCGSTGGYEGKVDNLKQFFPKTGKTKKKE